MKNGKNQCSAASVGDKKRCVKAYLLGSLAVFVVIFVFDMLVQGVFMTPYYKATASLWRPEAEMMHDYMYIGIIRQVVTALLFTCLYGWVKSGCGDTECPIKIGVKLGFKVGALLGIAMFGSYAWLPFTSMEIPLLWLVENIVLGMLIGATLGAICKLSKAKGFRRTTTQDS